MILRILNLVVIGALILAAAYVYRIKFNSTVQAERLAKLRSQVRHERDTIAALRAEWGELDNPARIQALAKRFLHAQADRADAVRHARPSAGPAAARHHADSARSDRRHDREAGSAATSVTGSIPPAPHRRRADTPRAAGCSRQRRTDGRDMSAIAQHICRCRSRRTPPHGC